MIQVLFGIADNSIHSLHGYSERLFLSVDTCPNPSDGPIIEPSDDTLTTSAFDILLIRPTRHHTWPSQLPTSWSSMMMFMTIWFYRPLLLPLLMLPYLSSEGLPDLTDRQTGINARRGSVVTCGRRGSLELWPFLLANGSQVFAHTFPRLSFFGHVHYSGNLHSGSYHMSRLSVPILVSQCCPCFHGAFIPV